MNDVFSVRDRVVVITGALGQLGRQFAQALLERGARVAGFDVGGDPRKLMDPLTGEQRANLMIVEADVTSRRSLEDALSQVTSKWGAPHGLINNAAIDSPPAAPVEENGPFESYPEASFDRVMDVNVKGVFLCCQVVGAAMAREGRGSIVNISSIYGVVSPNQTIYEYRRRRGEQFYKPVAYSVSKSAILNLSRYVATYWAPHGVRANTLTLAGVFNDQEQAFLDEYCRRIPIGRMAQPSEYNGAILFLISDASSYMTGSNMVVDGGWTAW